MDRSTLEAALIGYEFQLKVIEEKMAAVRAQLGGKAARVAATTTTDIGASKPKRTMSAAARKRIAAAQKKRWAAFHAKQAE